MSKLNGKIAALRERAANLTKDMQTFCLNPTLESFKEICACDSVKRSTGEDFTVWRNACLFKYGRKWGFKRDPEDFKKSIDLIEDSFMLYEDNFCKKAIEEPSKGRSLKVLHIFFAMGNLQYIETFYQCMGHEKINIETRRYLCEVYRNIKDLYKLRIINYTLKNPKHFEKLDVTRNVVDFTYFDNIKERMIQQKQQIKEQNQLLENMGAVKPRPKRPEYLEMPEKLYGIN